MIKPMLLSKGKWDENLKCSLPCGMSPTWHLDKGPCKAPYSLGEYLTNDLKNRGTDMMSSFINRSYENSMYVSTEVLSSSGSNYFYVIHIYDPSFFLHNEFVGFSLVEDYVITDIKQGRCKIIMVQDNEGMSGAKNTHHEFEMLKIDEWCDNVGILPTDVYYFSGNLLCKAVADRQNVRCNIIPVSIFESWVSVFEFPTGISDYTPIDDKNLFLCYSRRPRFHRVLFLTKMMSAGLIDRGLWSFSSMGNAAPIEEISKIDPNLITHLEELYAASPVTIDRENESDDITRYISMSDYQRTFLTVAGETLFDEDVLFITEKTFKPIMAGVPFIVNGNRGTLSYLKRLGYLTFDKWIDESYDDEPDYKIRVSTIVKEMERFSLMTTEELQLIREEMKPICLHNKLLITERTNSLFMTGNRYYPRKPTSDILYDIWKTWNMETKRLI